MIKTFKVILAILSVISYLLLSGACFVYLYNQKGFELNPYCLFAWGYSIASWVGITYFAVYVCEESGLFYIMEDN